MKCSLNLISGKSLQETISWFSSIGADWMNEDRIHEAFIKIEFVKTPAILEVISQIEQSISIHNISDKGVSFYLVDLMFGSVEQQELSFEFNKADGIVFVPMSNIKSISTVGNIVRRR